VFGVLNNFNTFLAMPDLRIS